MSDPIRLPLATLLVLGGLLSAGAARAAQSFDACQGRYIESLPVTISTQGVWCLRQDLATGISEGSAITIAANNVTIDCNDYKLGGLAAGPGTLALGIDAHNRLNATVRNCNIRGFLYGLYFTGNTRASSGGHVIENNRFNNITYSAINISGDGSVIENNKVLDTGGSTRVESAIPIKVTYDVDVLDNLVSGVAPSIALPGNSSYAWGVLVEYSAGRVAGNRVRGLSFEGSGEAVGIQVSATATTRTSVHDNDVIGPGSGYGIKCDVPAVVTHGNTISGFGTALYACTDDGNHMGP